MKKFISIIYGILLPGLGVFLLASYYYLFYHTRQFIPNSTGDMIVVGMGLISLSVGFIWWFYIERFNRTMLIILMSTLLISCSTSGKRRTLMKPDGEITSLSISFPLSIGDTVIIEEMSGSHVHNKMSFWGLYVGDEYLPEPVVIDLSTKTKSDVTIWTYKKCVVMK